jgi:hypothetical protein
MLSNPVGLQRPLLVLAGWRAPAWPASILARRLARLAGDNGPRAAALAFPLHTSFDAAVQRARYEAARRWPSQDIDVVGISMGGLIARAAAIPTGRDPLRIARLFTLATPHRGARAAPYVPLDPLARDMRAGGGFLRTLDEALPAAPYELICYTRLGDTWVGAKNTAPLGRDPFWVPGPPLLSHQTISADALIRADLARRLRAEPPLAARTSPPPRH